MFVKSLSPCIILYITKRRLSFPHVLRGSRPRLSLNANTGGVPLITSTPEIKRFHVIRSALQNSENSVYFCCSFIDPTFCSIYIRLQSFKFKVGKNISAAGCTHGLRTCRALGGSGAQVKRRLAGPYMTNWKCSCSVFSRPNMWLGY